MGTIEIYHGSSQIVTNPEYGKGRLHNDYGRGFYCTRSLDLAREWACFGLSSGGFVNAYRLRLDGLRLIDLGKDPHGPLNWMAVLLEHRLLNVPSPRVEEMRMEFISKYRVDLSGADVVIGPRADDTYTAYAKDFLMGLLSAPELEYALKLGALGEQVVIKSQDAFNSLEFQYFEPVDGLEWGQKRLLRERNATRLYREMLAGKGLPNKPTIRDLVEG